MRLQQPIDALLAPASSTQILEFLSVSCRREVCTHSHLCPGDDRLLERSASTMDRGATCHIGMDHNPHSYFFAI